MFLSHFYSNSLIDFQIPHSIKLTSLSSCLPNPRVGYWWLQYSRTHKGIVSAVHFSILLILLVALFLYSTRTTPLSSFRSLPLFFTVSLAPSSLLSLNCHHSSSFPFLLLSPSLICVLFVALLFPSFSRLPPLSCVPFHKSTAKPTPHTHNRHRRRHRHQPLSIIVDSRWLFFDVFHTFPKLQHCTFPLISCPENALFPVFYDSSFTSKTFLTGKDPKKKKQRKRISPTLSRNFPLDFRVKTPAGCLPSMLLVQERKNTEKNATEQVEKLKRTEQPKSATIFWREQYFKHDTTDGQIDTNYGSLLSFASPSWWSSYCSMRARLPAASKTSNVD